MQTCISMQYIAVFMQYIFIYLQYLRHLFIITVCSDTVYEPFNFAMWKLKAEF